jgi:hypothetical protein
MQVVFALLAVQFFLPSCSYLFAPELALHNVDTIGRLLGGGAYPVAAEQGYIFRVLAAGNVFTLGFLCLLMLLDIRRYPTLVPVFAVLKGYSAIGYLYVFFVKLRNPLFVGVFFWDGLALFLVVFLGRRAFRAVSQSAR